MASRSFLLTHVPCGKEVALYRCCICLFSSVEKQKTSACFVQITSIRDYPLGYIEAHWLYQYGYLKGHRDWKKHHWKFLLERRESCFLARWHTSTYFPQRKGLLFRGRKRKRLFSLTSLGVRVLIQHLLCNKMKWGETAPPPPWKTKTYLQPSQAMPNGVWSDIASLPEPKLIIKDYYNNKRRWMAFLLGCNGKMCAVWMGYTSICADISRGPLLLAQPIYSQSQQFGQSLPATSSSSKADVWRNRSLARAHVRLSVPDSCCPQSSNIRDISFIWKTEHNLFWIGKVFLARKVTGAFEG